MIGACNKWHLQTSYFIYKLIFYPLMNDFIIYLRSNRVFSLQFSGIYCNWYITSRTIFHLLSTAFLPLNIFSQRVSKFCSILPTFSIFLAFLQDRALSQMGIIPKACLPGSFSMPPYFIPSYSQSTIEFKTEKWTNFWPRQLLMLDAVSVPEARSVWDR